MKNEKQVKKRLLKLIGENKYRIYVIDFNVKEKVVCNLAFPLRTNDKTIDASIIN
jgi:hypothetical protein